MSLTKSRIFLGRTLPQLSSQLTQKHLKCFKFFIFLFLSCRLNISTFYLLINIQNDPLYFGLYCTGTDKTVVQFIHLKVSRHHSKEILSLKSKFTLPVFSKTQALGLYVGVAKGMGPTSSL